MKKIVGVLIFLLAYNSLWGQGLNHQWLMGSFNFLQDPKGRILFDVANYNLINEFRKMPFKGTQGNISDSNGNLLMSSNGVWIANATGDTMMNGSGINPGGITPNWPYGLPLMNNNIFLPFPGELDKYALFHHSAIFNGLYSPCNTLYLSKIDLSLDSGLGGVTSKNEEVIQDTLNWGIGSCRHANGRDWWIVMMKDSSDIIYKVLLTPSGIASVTPQNLMYQPLPYGQSVQLTFSQDGTKMLSTTYYPEHDLPMDSANSSIIIFDFDRCTGLFSNSTVIHLIDNNYLWGLAFSPSGKYAYACSSNNIFQIDTDIYTVDTVATYDGFISPPIGGFPTTFYNMYLAANGKIYITSGSSVQHIHEMNYPDSSGLACDVQQHAIDLVNYLYLSSVPNHPNYYLGCDTTSGCPCLATGIADITSYDFNFNVSPNPSTGSVSIIYLLPQNTDGKLEVFDFGGKKVFEMHLPAWSTLQSVNLSASVMSGIYNCVITSGNERVNKKIAIFKE